MARSDIKLTKRVVDLAVPSDKRFELWDSELRGFGLRVEPSGTKTYLLRYRPKGIGSSAPKRFVTIGRHGHLTAEQARQSATALLRDVALGADPAATAHDIKVAPMFPEAAALFMKEHVRAKRKASTGDYYQWLITQIIAPEFVHFKAELVTRRDVAKLHLKLSQSPYQANRVVAVISSIYTFLQKRELVPIGYNPATGIERFKEQGRERYLSTDELARLGSALRIAEESGL